MGLKFLLLSKNKWSQAKPFLTDANGVAVDRMSAVNQETHVDAPSVMKQEAIAVLISF